MVSASIATAGALITPPRRANAIVSQATDGVQIHSRRIDAPWQFRIGPIDGIWEAWRGGEDNLWQSVTLPHCFNAQDACDPDTPYFRGRGWYRTHLSIQNPFPRGRTLLHFQGAGQSATVWVGSQCIGTHTGGYDEFSFDITDAVQHLASTDSTAGVPIAVMCDNSPNLERAPSDLSDFCLFGGLYRHVNLVYLPALALDTVHVLPAVVPDGAAEVSVRARIYNPANTAAACNITVAILDAAGQPVHSSTRTLQPWQNFADIASFRVPNPQLWSPDSPHLYSCRVTLANSTGQSQLDERFGIRTTEFVERGPFKLNGKRVLLRGTHRHADHAGVAAAMSDDLVRQEMQLIREMGANFIRLAHYQQDRLVLDRVAGIETRRQQHFELGVGEHRQQRIACRSAIERGCGVAVHHRAVLLYRLDRLHLDVLEGGDKRDLAAAHRGATLRGQRVDALVHQDLSRFRRRAAGRSCRWLESKSG